MPFSLISSLASGYMNMMDSQMAREDNRENMLLQSSLNRNQYMFEREMESPEKQRELYEKAGLNPALLYGGAGSSIATGAGISGTTATATAPTNPMRITAPSMLELAQVRSVNEDTKGKQIDNITRANKNYLDLLDKKTEIETKLSQKDLNQAQADKYRKELDEIQARIDLLNAQTDTEKERTGLVRSQIDTEKTEQTKNKAQSRSANASALGIERKRDWEENHTIDGVPQPFDMYMNAYGISKNATDNVKSWLRSLFSNAESQSGQEDKISSEIESLSFYKRYQLNSLRKQLEYDLKVLENKDGIYNDFQIRKANESILNIKKSAERFGISKYLF